MLVNLMDEGYILSNKFRKAVFDGFASGETDINIIAKKYHVFSRIAKKILKDFIENDIILKKNDRYLLSEKGKKIADRI